MKEITKSIIISLIIIFLSVQSVLLVQADLTISFNDSLNDVFVCTNYSYYNHSFNQSANPDIDIKHVEYHRQTNSDEVRVTLRINETGTIINQSDLDSMQHPTKTGRTVAYVMQLVTNERHYTIVYMNKSCTVSYENASCTVGETYFTVTFQLDSIFEEYDYLIAAAYDVINTTEDGYLLYIDGAPNDKMISINIDVYPQDFKVDQPRTFQANIYDFYGTAEPPFTYTWDFDDGTIIEQENVTQSQTNVTYSYENPGIYTVKVYFEDAEQHYGYDELIIDVNKKDPEYQLYQVTWEKKTRTEGLTAFTSKKNPYETSLILDAPAHHVITKTEIMVQWEDDHTYGIIKTWGQDMVTAHMYNKNEHQMQTTMGSGEMFFDFDEETIPHNFTLAIYNNDSVYQFLNAFLSGKNQALYETRIEIEIGEKIWRPFKFLKDTGNRINIDITYEYYKPIIQLIQEE